MPAIIPKVPWSSSHAANEHASPLDYVLQPAFTAAFICMSLTVSRMLCLCILLPLYLSVACYRSVWPYLVQNLRLLLSSSGRLKLKQHGEFHAIRRQQLADSQLAGTYTFESADVEPSSTERETQQVLRSTWPANRDYFLVGNLRTCVVHEKPAQPPKGTVVLLHGNPSWSYMYRNARTPVCTSPDAVLTSFR